MIFGGDLTNPVKSVTDAIALGKQAAMALDTFFKTGLESIETRLASCRVGNGNALSMEIYTNGERKKRNPHTVLFNEINADYFQSLSRSIPDSLAPFESSISFSEIEKSYSEDSAIEESKRCFNCGICNDCDNCRLFCPDISVQVSSNGANISLYPLTYRFINLDYCKGCGICVVECPGMPSL